MKKSKLLLTLIALFTLIAFSSCSEFEEDIDFEEEAEVQATEITVRRGGINDYVGGWAWKKETTSKNFDYQDGNDLFLRKRPRRN